MSEETNKDSLSKENEKFIVDCKKMDEEDNFCMILEHNKSVSETKGKKVPFISSDTYIVYDGKLVHSYAK